MYLLQLSTGYNRQFAKPTRINVTDQSEISEAEISIGKNLLTNQWCGSMRFEPWLNEENLSLCCGAPKTDFGFCEACKENV